MKREDRRKGIMDLLHERGRVDLQELAEQFGVSKMTIHRDLDELEGEGVLRKVRGGASLETTSRFESDYLYRRRVGAEDKASIARAALDLVEPGMTVLIGDGTTNSLLGPLVPQKRPLTVITNSYDIIETLRNESGISLISTGGAYSPKFNGFFGLVAEESLARLRADVAFLCSAAVDGVQTFHMDNEVVRTKRVMLEISSRSYLLADHRKFNRTALHHVAKLSEFAGVITDRCPDLSIVRRMSDSGAQYILPGESRAEVG